MKTFIRLGLFAVLVIGTWACKGSKESAKKDAEVAPRCKSLVAKAAVFEQDVASPISIEYIKQNGTELEIKYSYGGCGGEPIQLYWSGAIMKSQPPKMSLMLVNEAPTLCKKMNVVTDCFDFSAQLSTYGEIILIVQGYEEQVIIRRPE
jgi:hypothetical protein